MLNSNGRLPTVSSVVYKDRSNTGRSWPGKSFVNYFWPFLLYVTKNSTSLFFYMYIVCTRGKVGNEKGGVRGVGIWPQCCQGERLRMGPPALYEMIVAGDPSHREIRFGVPDPVAYRVSIVVAFHLFLTLLPVLIVYGPCAVRWLLGLFGSWRPPEVLNPRVWRVGESKTI